MEVKNESKIGKNLVGSFFFNTVFANEYMFILLKYPECKIWGFISFIFGKK